MNALAWELSDQDKADILDALYVDLDDLTYKIDEEPQYYEPEDIESMKAKRARIQTLIHKLSEVK